MLKELKKSSSSLNRNSPSRPITIEDFEINNKPKKFFPRSISNLRTHYLGESLGNEDHPINKYIRGGLPRDETFLPYKKERDTLNRLIKVSFKKRGGFQAS